MSVKPTLLTEKYWREKYLLKPITLLWFCKIGMLIHYIYQKLLWTSKDRHLLLSERHAVIYQHKALTDCKPLGCCVRKLQICTFKANQECSCRETNLKVIFVMPRHKGLGFLECVHSFIQFQTSHPYGDAKAKATHREWLTELRIPVVWERPPVGLYKGTTDNYLWVEAE